MPHSSSSIERLFEELSDQCISSREQIEPSNCIDPNLIDASVGFLASDDAINAIKLDPYWPKWSSPWWQMLLLFEMGMADRIPNSAVEAMCDLMNTHYLKIFPFKAEQIPEGTDPYRHIACHCALGTMTQVLTACGVNIEQRLPWIFPWYLKYQLSDGGLNCDEAAYAKKDGKGSVISTVTVLESILNCPRRELSIEEMEFADRCADYLIRRKIYLSSKTGQLIDESWGLLCFPRFYQFDALRGLSVLINWSKLRKKELPSIAIVDVVRKIHESFPDGKIKIGRNAWKGLPTRFYDEQKKEWKRADSSSFLLLDSVSAEGKCSPFLTQSWQSAVAGLFQIREQGLLI